MLGAKNPLFQIDLRLVSFRTIEALSQDIAERERENECKCVWVCMWVVGCGNVSNLDTECSSFRDINLRDRN